MLSRLPITVSAPILVGVPALAVGVTVTLMWNSQSRSAVRELADRNIEQIHHLASNKVADVLSVPVRVCEVNAHLVESGILDPEDLHAWRETFLKQARAFDMLSSVVWGGADGRSAWVTRYADGAHYWALKADGEAPTMSEWRLEADGDAPSEPTGEFEFDLFARPWFTTVRDAGIATWSEPFVWVGGADSGAVTLGISYGVPVHDSAGRFRGVVDADYSLNDLSSFLRSIEVGTTGVAALLGRDGALLATSNDAPVTTAQGDRIAATESSDPDIAAAAGFFHAGALTGEDHITVQIDGQPHYALASPIGREVGLDWTLLTVVPESDFTAQIDRGFRRSSIASGLAVALAVMAGVVAARWLVSPLLTLVTAVRRIGQGDLDTSVRVRHAPEYTNLADEINRMTHGLQDRMRMRESLSLAMEVQRNLLPSGSPTIRGLDIAGHSTYCDETGGDYYDFLDVSGVEDDAAVVALGDVMGHGIAAAMLMATARGILRSRCAVPGSLADFLDHLNGMLVGDTQGKRFMTMLLVIVHAERREMRWASAGHGPPIVYDPSTDSFPEYDGGGIPLGIVAEEDYEEYLESGITPGSIILAATDGLWETMGENGELFGMERLRALLRDNARKPAAEISQKIRDTLVRYRGPADPDDDLTFVIIKTR